MKRVSLVLFVVAMLTAPAAFGDMVANWNFNDGTATDLVVAGGQQNGTLMGGTSIVYDGDRDSLVASLPGGVGGGNWIDCGPVLDKIRTAVTACSVTAWIKAEPTTYNGEWKCIVGSGGSYVNLYLTNDAQVGIMSGNPLGNTAEWNPNYQEWQHLAGTFDGSSFKIYVNGVFAASAAAVGTLWGAGDDRHFTIGGRWDQQFPGFYYPPCDFKGLIDDVRWYNNALDLAGVRASMNEIPEPVTIALLGLGSLLLRRRNA